MLMPRNKFARCISPLRVLSISISAPKKDPTEINPAYIRSNPRPAINPDFLMISFLASKEVCPFKFSEIITTAPTTTAPMASKV